MTPPRRNQPQKRQDNRMPNGPNKATNIAPRFNNNPGSQARGRMQQGPGKVPGGMPNAGVPGFKPKPGGNIFPGAGNFGQGGQGWMGPPAQGQGPGRPGQQGPGGPGGPGGPPRQNWQQRGFESKDAAQSVQRQYGMVQQPGGGYGKPDYDFLVRQMEANGWGPQFQASSPSMTGTPINIGGMRWMSGRGGVNYTGQAANSPYQGPSASAQPQMGAPTGAWNPAAGNNFDQPQWDPRLQNQNPNPMSLWGQ